LAAISPCWENAGPMPDLALADLLRPELAELSAYLPAQGDFAIRLDANEAPPLLGVRARARLAEVAGQTAWERYPDARALELRRAIAHRSGVSPEEVLVGVGSDEVIALLLTVLSRPRSGSQQPGVLTTTPTFVMYRMAARVRGCRVIEVPLDENWDLAESSMLRAIEFSPPNLVFVASPNNPTGTCPSLERLKRVIAAADGSLVVIDEAYVDYARGDCFELYRDHPNVAITRTLSKLGFAALRVGWLIARPELIAELDKARLPFNLSTLSQRLASVVLEELWEEVRATTRTLIEERERLTAAVARLPRVSLTESHANFLWLRTEAPAASVMQGLIERRILVRSFHERGGRLAHQLRVTVGLPEQNDAFVSALSEVV
jgi:histidinol-phosphate aminotransferase